MRTATGYEVNVEHPGPMLAHEYRSKSKKKRGVKSLEDVNKSGKKKRAKSPGLKEPSSEAISSSLGNKKRRMKSAKKSKSPHKKKSGSTGMDRSESRKSSLDNRRGTMSAEGQ